MSVIDGELQSTVTSFTDYSGYRVHLVFDAEVNQGGSVFLIAQTEHAYVDSNGSFELTISDQITFHDDIAFIEVYAPNGQLVYKKQYKKHELLIDDPDDPVQNRLHIEFEPVLVDPSLASSRAVVRGQIISFCGCNIKAGTKLVLWGCAAPPIGDEDSASDTEESSGENLGDNTNEEPESDSDENSSDNITFHPSENLDLCKPILVTQTDDSGEFVFFRPEDNFHSVWVQWGDGSRVSPVQLEADGSLPNTINIVEHSNEVGHHEEKPCHCDDNGGQNSELGTSCNVKFSPNRTLEEHVARSLVRTTAPQIERHKITPAELYDISEHIKEVSDTIETQLASMAIDNDAVEYFNADGTVFVASASTSISPWWQLFGSIGG